MNEHQEREEGVGPSRRSQESRVTPSDRTLDEILECFNELRRLQSDLAILNRKIDRAMKHLLEAMKCYGELTRQLDPEPNKLKIYDPDDPYHAEKMREEDEHETSGDN